VYLSSAPPHHEDVVRGAGVFELLNSVADRVHGVDFDAIITRAARRADEVEQRRLVSAAPAYPMPLAAAS